MSQVALLDYFQSWDPKFRRSYVPEWPSRCLCVDTEYDSSSRDTGLIWEVGHAIVSDGVVVDRANHVLNWYMYPQFTTQYLDGRLADIASRVGFDWRLTPQVVQQEGVDPIKVLRFYLQLFTQWAKQDAAFVMQNGQAADEVLFSANFQRFLGKNFMFPDHTYFDTGCMFKAAQAWMEPASFGRHKVEFSPTSMDTPKSYFRRVSLAKIRGLQWRLGLIVEKFSLLEKYAIPGVQTNFHNALYDAECLSWIMNEFGGVYKLLSAAGAKPAQFPEFLSVGHVASIVDEELAGPKMVGYPPGQPQAFNRQRNV